MRKGLPLVLLVAVLMLFTGAQARDLTTKQISFPADDIEALVANVDLAAGEFSLTSQDISDILRAKVEYNDRRVEIYSDYKKKRNTGYLELGSDLLSKTHVQSEDNRWEMILSRKYKTDLSIDMGLCSADIDLGGIPLSYINIDVGAASGTIKFNEPNPIIADDIKIDAGASKLEVEKLGNANFKFLKFDGGVGKFKIDMTGEYKTNSRAEISIGLGKATIYLPSSLPLRVESETSFLSSVKFKNERKFNVEDGFFESLDFAKSEVRLDLKIDVGLGSVDVVWVD